MARRLLKEVKEMRDIIVESERLSIVPRDLEAMKQLFEEEADDDMKLAYADMLAAMRDLPGREEWGTEWAITLKTGELVGGICFKGEPDAEGSVEIGYGIKGEHQHQGYATEAVGAMLRWALEQEGVKKICAQTDLRNIISQRVLIRNGFLRDGFGDEGPRFVYVK